MLKLSIVVPVFNVEKYLHKCLTSLINQDISIDEYEIIIVNDGSTDKSLEIATHYEKVYSNIKILSQNNSGLSAARNTGLKGASGKYIWFIDSDDWIKENCLLKLLSLCESNEADMLSINWNKINESNKVSLVKSVSKYLGIATSGKECILEDKYLNPVQLYIYRKQFLENNSLLFTAGIYHEDVEFTPKAIYLADRIFLSGESVYYYLQRKGSIMNQINPKNCFDLIAVSNYLEEFIHHRIKEKEIKQIMYRRVFKAIRISATLAKGLEDKNIAEEIFKLIKSKKSFIKILFNDPKISYKIESVLFIFFPHQFSYIYNHFRNIKNDKLI